MVYAEEVKGLSILGEIFVIFQMKFFKIELEVFLKKIEIKVFTFFKLKFVTLR